MNKMNSVAHKGATVEAVTQKVNNGQTDIAERKKYYNQCVKVFK
jgi:predicted chitinase